MKDIDKEAGLAKPEGWRAWLPAHVAGWQDGFGVQRSTNAPEVIVVEVARKQFQLYENEFAFLLDKMLGFATLAAPVAADTEQATDERAAFDAWLAQGNACGANHSLWKGWQARAALAAPLATPADAPAQQQKATLGDVWKSGGVHWDLFPGYLIDHREGDIISEEGLQFALADMLKDADYLRVVSERATPADAGADEQMYWQGVEDGKRMEREVARMSTPGAPVTASDEELRKTEGYRMGYLEGMSEGARLATEEGDMPVIQIAYSGKDETGPFTRLFNAKHVEPGPFGGYVAIIDLPGQSPAPVTAEPVAMEKAIIARVQAAICDANNGADIYMASMIAASRIMGDLAPAPADRDAIRDQALEEAEAICLKSSNEYLSHEELAQAIRALKSMERAADAAETRDAKGGV